jgi:hypothetical protein
MNKVIHHIISDTHIDLLKNVNSLADLVAKSLIKNFDINDTTLKSKVLLLPGDIGNPLVPSYWSFLQDCTNKYKNVLFTTGNHEYYCRTLRQRYSIDQIDELIRERAKEIPNLHFLQKDSIVIDDIQYVGCTLWTKIPKQDELIIRESMNDYEQIYKSEDKLILPKDTTEIHNDHIKWLNTVLENNNNLEKTIVITHHLPSERLIDKKYKKYYELNHAFYTNLENMIKPNIKLWVIGHTHTAKEITINNIPLIVNPLGYKNENNNTTIKEFIL